MEALIRLATEAEIPEIGRLFSKVYTNEHFDKFTPDKSIEYIDWLFRRCPELAFVAVQGERIVGAKLAATKPFFDGLHMVDSEIFVDPDYRRQGIGLNLTKKSFETAKEMGVTVVDSATFIQDESENPKWSIKHEYTNLEWHKKNGFHRETQMVLMYGNIDELIDKTTQHLQQSH